jgi:hypothetical protein
MLSELLREFVELFCEEDKSVEDIEDEKTRHKRNATPDEWRANRDKSFEDRVSEMMFEPEFADIDAFVHHKLDSDEYTFDAAELQALARNVDGERLGHVARVASTRTSSEVKNELVNDYGFKFDPRKPTKHVELPWDASLRRHGRWWKRIRI